MSFSPRGGRVRLWDAAALAPGTYYEQVHVGSWENVALQWQQPNITAASDAVLSVYSACEPWNSKALTPEDATNPSWTLEPLAVWASNPGASKLSDMLTLEDNPWPTLLVRVDVINAMTDFTLVVSGH